MPERNEDDRRTSTEPVVDGEEPAANGRISLGRREVMTAVGALVVTPAVAVQSTSANEGGYGTVAYGEGAYGNPPDDGSGGTPGEEPEEHLAAETLDPTSVGESSATLNGELTELEGYDEAVVYFEWGPRGDLSNATAGQTLSSAGAFDVRVSDLEAGTEYEYRAVAEAEDDSNTGDARSFTTDSAQDEPDAAPQIERLFAEDTSNPNNPHTDVCIEWLARLEEGQLDSATLTVSDSSGVVLSWDYDLCEACGKSASRSEDVRLHRGGGETYEVELTVRSKHGTTDSEQTTFDSP